MKGVQRAFNMEKCINLNNHIKKKNFIVSSICAGRELLAKVTAKIRQKTSLLS